MSAALGCYIALYRDVIDFSLAVRNCLRTENIQ